MSVITISRGTFCGGKMLAECLASHLGYRCIDRDVIVEKAAVYGVSQDDLRQALLKPPGFLDRFQHKKYVYLALIQAALAEEVRTGRVVYHGNAGHLLLKGGAVILRVRIIAPLNFRIRMAQERLEKSAAEVVSYIKRMDQERQRWTHYLYGVDWGDPSLYDLVVNLEHMDIPQACSIIAFTTMQKCYEFTPECQATLNDLALASRVRASLAINSPTSHLELEVTSNSGLVSIQGRLSDMNEIEEIERIASGVVGVTGLNLGNLAPAVQA